MAEVINKKIKSLARRIAPLIVTEPLTPSIVYIKLQNVVKSQSDYFKVVFRKEITDYVKLIFYVYSLLKTNDFSLGDKLISEMTVQCVLDTENINFTESCEYCYGNGYTDCDDCDGTGRIECDKCDSNGEEECDTCDGTGSLSCDTCDGTGEDEEGNECTECNGSGEYKCDDCNGRGKKECSVCDGDKEVTCQSCYGDGTESCDNCSGDGYVNTDQVIYTTYTILTKNRDIINRCEINQNTDNPVATEQNAEEFWKNCVILYQEEKHADPQIEFQYDVPYCYYYSNDLSELYLGGHYSIRCYEEDTETDYFD